MVDDIFSGNLSCRETTDGFSTSTPEMRRSFPPIVHAPPDDTMDPRSEDTDSDDTENPADEDDGEKSLVSANC